jgi:endonuclease/exonuclease/phosphatase family metal-dependent hydrolase
MASSLKVLCWNIAEGRVGEGLPSEVDAALSRIAAHIRSKSPDIVLLNEVRQPNPIGRLHVPGIKNGRIDQTRFLAKEIGLPYCSFLSTNRTGCTGHKGVAVLSRHPLGPAYLHRVMYESKETGFGTLVTSITVGDKLHHILSTRLAPHNGDGSNRAENPWGIRQALELVKSLVHSSGPDSALIFGGDFNASTKPGTHEYEEEMVRFFAECGLKEVVQEKLKPVDTHRVDYLFCSGGYKVMDAAFDEPNPRASDHPWIFAELES